MARDFGVIVTDAVLRCLKLSHILSTNVMTFLSSKGTGAVQCRLDDESKLANETNDRSLK